MNKVINYIIENNNLFKYNIDLFFILLFYSIFIIIFIILSFFFLIISYLILSYLSIYSYSFISPIYYLICEFICFTILMIFSIIHFIYSFLLSIIFVHPLSNIIPYLLFPFSCYFHSVHYLDLMPPLNFILHINLILDYDFIVYFIIAYLIPQRAYFMYYYHS